MAHTHSTQWNYLYGTLNDFVTENSTMLTSMKIDTSVGFMLAIYCLVEKQNTVVTVRQIRLN